MGYLLILLVILLKTIIHNHKTIAYLCLLLIQNEITVTIPLLTVKIGRYPNLAIIIINFSF